ncbi:type VI secretion system tube protein Hcp [Micromonospora chersina]|uniref:type VI secretion system tube protein Hcp n=1 Tax=Micromonospora chersina TaxID=47854 RepID=UPI0037917144
MRRWTRSRALLASAAVAAATGAAMVGTGLGPQAPALAAPATGTTTANPVHGGIVIAGITGEGTAIKTGIDVLSFSNTATAATGTVAGKATVNELQVSGVLDAAYPTLLQFLTAGRIVPSVVLTGCADPKLCTATASIEIDLTNATLNKVAIGSDGQVDFSLVFSQITWKFLRNGAVVSQSQFTLV